MRKVNLIIVFTLILPLLVIAQNRKTDRETDGLKGSVKSILTERADLKEKSGKLVESTRKPEEAITYDTAGNRLTWKTYDYLTGTLFDSVIYSRIDGDKVALYENIDSPNKITAGSPTKNKNSSTRDSRYTNKFKYKYDDKGNVSEEAWHQNDGSLWMRYVYKFNGNQIEELVYAADGSLNQKYVSILDEKGNEVEMHFYDVKSDKIEGKETYKYLEFDAEGNWTKRITSEGDAENKFKMKPREIIYRTLTYF